MSKPKQQGTTWERQATQILHTAGWDVTRLAEGGPNDIGDLYAIDPNNKPWVIECKWRERLQPHKALAAAARKASLLGDVDVAVALWWKRSVLGDGNVRRSADGAPSVVVTDPADWLYR